MVIAIDGPGASGKSTVGELVARRLGYRFVDTGGMYRALTWLALQKRLDFEDYEALVRLAEQTPIVVLPGDAAFPHGRFLVGTDDLTPFLHQPAVDAMVSTLSRIPGVRRVLVEQQRRIAGEGDTVMAGRDIGTVVLPDAPLKIYLDASSEERARRRFEEMQRLGIDGTHTGVLEDLRARDQVDKDRTTSPLRPAADAWIINTDRQTPDEIATAIVAALAIRHSEGAGAPG